MLGRWPGVAPVRPAGGGSGGALRRRARAAATGGPSPGRQHLAAVGLGLQPVSRCCSAALRAATWAACCVLLRGQRVEGALAAAAGVRAAVAAASAPRPAPWRGDLRRSAATWAFWAAAAACTVEPAAATGSAAASRCRPGDLRWRSRRALWPQRDGQLTHAPGPGRSGGRSARRVDVCSAMSASVAASSSTARWPRWPGRRRAARPPRRCAASASASTALAAARAACAAGQLRPGCAAARVGSGRSAEVSSSWSLQRVDLAVDPALLVLAGRQRGGRHAAVAISVTARRQRAVPRVGQTHASQGGAGEAGVARS